MAEMTCGDCRFFLVENHRDDGRIGRCKLGKLMGVFREATGACSSFSRPGDTALPTPTSAARSARQRSPAAPVQFTVSSGAVTQLLSTLEPLTFKGVLIDLLTARCALPIASVPMRWEGDVRLLPADDSLKSKDIPVEQFLAKAFAVRDNLRVMEQKINSNAKIPAAVKLELQSWLTRAQASILNFASGWHHQAGESAEGAVLLEQLADEADWKGLVSKPQLADRWRGGRVEYGDSDVSEGVESFFLRLSLMRDALLNLELKVESLMQLDKEDAGTLVSYLRRSQGSLTTFNILFKARSDYFSSSRA